MFFEQRRKKKIFLNKNRIDFLGLNSFNEMKSKRYFNSIRKSPNSEDSTGELRVLHVNYAYLRDIKEER